MFALSMLIRGLYYVAKDVTTSDVFQFSSQGYHTKALIYMRRPASILSANATD